MGNAPQVAEWAAVQQKAEAQGGLATPPELYAEAGAEATDTAAEPQPAKAPEPVPAPTPEPVPATETAPTPGPRAAAEETKATAATGPDRCSREAEPTSAAAAEPPRAESLGKEGKKKSSMGALFSALTPRSRRSSKDKAPDLD